MNVGSFSFKITGGSWVALASWFKIMGGACVALLVSWAMLKIVEYLDASRDAATETVTFFDQAKSGVSDLAVSWGAADGPDDKHTAILLHDRSSSYGGITEHVRIADDDKTHVLSVDVKAGTSPLAQLLLWYLGGARKLYYVNVNTKDMSVTGEGAVASKDLGGGWYRITVAGANNKSGNTMLRAQIYPRQGKPEDTGSLFIANARLDP